MQDRTKGKTEKETVANDFTGGRQIAKLQIFQSQRPAIDRRNLEWLYIWVVVWLVCLLVGPTQSLGMFKSADCTH